jgi:hypothetical protein
MPALHDRPQRARKEPAKAADEAWAGRFRRLVHYSEIFHDKPIKTLLRLKQWASLARRHGDFPHFDAVKRTETTDEFFEALSSAESKDPSLAAILR